MTAMSSTTVEFDSSVLERLVVSPDSAEAVLSMKFSPEDEEHMRELLDKNNKGTITEQERQQMESYRRIGSFLAILQARARLYLKNTTDDSSQPE